MNMEEKNYDIGGAENVETRLSTRADGKTVFKSSRKGRKKKKKGKSVLKGVLRALCLLLVSAGIAAVVLTGLSDYIGIAKSDKVEVTVEKGMSTGQIAAALKKSGAIRFPLLYRAYSKYSGADGKYNYGLYVIEGDLSYDNISDALQKPGIQSDSVSVCIPEGSSVDDIAGIMESKGVCTADEFKSVAKSDSFDYPFLDKENSKKVYYPVEGYLYPETYMFYAFGGEDSAKLAITRMLDEFETKVYEKFGGTSKLKESKYSFNEIMTMASIVELESGKASKEDKCNVAAVFYNRLSWDEPHFLGSDPTTKYPYGNGKYNTYKSEGLPPGPLCSPSVDSVYAAANPTEGFTACYFVTDSDFKFYYNDTLSGHNSTVSRLKKQGKWLG